MIRRAALASVALLLLSTGTASAGVPAKTVSIPNLSFDPATVKVTIGDQVRWSNSDNLTHTTTANFLNWWNRTLGPGDATDVTHARGGTFAYRCTIHPSMTGKVKVRPFMDPPSGNTLDTFVLHVATLDAQAGFIEDVQRRKGSKPFKFFDSTEATQVVVHFSNPGTYQFRSRLRRTSDGLHTGWSAPITVQVTN